MKELKFRYWDKNEKKMYYSNEFESLADFFQKVGKNLKFVMQYTTTKDKNGKEIYEGDIIWGYARMFYMSEEGDEIYIVEWENPIDIDTDFPCRQIGYLLDDEEKMEVVGNIYENPDLAKAVRKHDYPECDRILGREYKKEQ